MKKPSEVKTLWNEYYSVLIPAGLVAGLFLADKGQMIDIMLICESGLFGEMLASVITFMSIIISIFGFLIPSLISAKNDVMVKYFIEHANMPVFVGKIKSVVLSGLLGIFLSVLLYLHNNLGSIFLKVLLFSWIGVALNFACNSYRFISIIISLLLMEKKDDGEKKCANTASEEKIKNINSKIPRL